MRKIVCKSEHRLVVEPGQEVQRYLPQKEIKHNETEYPGKLYSFQDERTFTGKVKKIKLKPYEVLWLVSKKSK